MKTIQTALVFCATLLVLAQLAIAQCPYDLSTNDGTITIVQYTGVGGYITIPSTINGLPVTGIGDNAFLPSSGDESAVFGVALPASVTNLGVYAFVGVASLEEITVDAQNPCFSSVDGILFNQNQTMLVQFPGALYGSYTIPAGVTCIGDYSFSDTMFLTSVTVPNSVTNIGDSAFADCPDLAGVYFAGNAPTADPSVFDDNFNPITVYYLPGTTGWCSTFGGYPTMLWNPLIQTGDGSFGVQTNQFGFNITGTNDFTVVVEACTNLACPVWIPLQTITLNNGSYYFNDPQWTNYPGRFYGLGLP